MIVPSIDLMNGQAVQLVGGRDKALDAGPPLPLLERFRLAGEVAVIDLDAAMKNGSHRVQIEALCREAPCRVGGGIRDVATAVAYLDAGARKIILGTAARPEILRELPRERVIAALDAAHGEVVVDGWRTRTGRGIVERMLELKDLVSGFLVTFVEREGRLGGTDLERIRELVAAAGPARITAAGGITTAQEIAELDRMGVDAQVGMAIYTGRLDLADAIAAPLSSDRPDGLWPTIVVDESERALGLAWSNSESLRIAVAERRGVYWSRTRGLWRKGETSGAVQELLRVDVDCDRDALRFVVKQTDPGFCHLAKPSCFGDLSGIPTLARRLASLAEAAPKGSYTRRLLEDPTLLGAKLREEATELGAAQGKDEAAWEAADLIYFTLVALVKNGATLEDVERELDRRALRVTRRAGNAKPEEAVVPKRDS